MERFEPGRVRAPRARARHPLVGAAARGDGDAHAIPTSRRSSRCATCAACRRRSRRRHARTSTSASAWRSSTATARPSSAVRSSAGPPPTGRSSARPSSARSGARTRGSTCVSSTTSCRCGREKSAPADAATLGDRVTDDGWLRTGDLARIDDDGFVWIDGRVSAMVNRGGLKVFPDEVEEHLREHPAVADAAVAGVPDDRLGEVPWAFVVLEPGATIDADAARVVPAAHGRLQGAGRRHRGRRASPQRDRQAAAPRPRAARRCRGCRAGAAQSVLLALRSAPQPAHLLDRAGDHLDAGAARRPRGAGVVRYAHLS